MIDWKTKTAEHQHTEKAHTGAPAHDHGHGHTHGVVDPSILTTDRGMWALKWSFFALFLTALFQVVVVWLSGSVALLADTIHNFGDAATAIPLFIAFSLARWKPTKTFTYGFGRVEDLAGVLIVVTILASAVIAGYQSIGRIIEPQPVENLWIVVVASIIGFAGNEAVALFRIRVGREIGSAALVADGHHARTDGFTSLAVLFGAIGVWLGFPLADPIAGLIITVMILKIVWDSSKLVFTRLLGGVEPGVVDRITQVAKETRGVLGVTDVRTAWLGHRMYSEVSIAVDPEITVAAAHEIAVHTRRHLLDGVDFLHSAAVHVDPADALGEEFHDTAHKH